MERDQENQTISHENEKTASAVLKLLAIIGLVAILALAAWMSIQVIRLAPTAFSTVSTAVSSTSVSLSSIFTREQKDEVTFALSTSTLASDEPFTIEWDSETEATNVTYALEYECADGFSLQVLEGEEVAETECGTPHEFSSDDSTLQIIPVSSDNRFLDVTLTLRALSPVATGTPEELAADTVTLTVINDEVADSPSTLANADIDANDSTAVNAPAALAPNQTASAGTAPVTTPVAPAAPRTPTTVYVPNPRFNEDPNGQPDLAVDIVATGIVVEADGKDSFFPVAAIPSDQRAAVQFVVENVGTKSSDEWEFTANLPIEGDDDFEFESGDQEALRPGDKVTFTLKFDTILEENAGRIKIELDSGSSDKNSANDDDVVIVTIDEK